MNAKYRITHGVDININCAARVTEPAKTTTCFNAHVSPLAISLLKETLGDFVGLTFVETHAKNNIFIINGP